MPIGAPEFSVATWRAACGVDELEMRAVAWCLLD
jgi:hypothetical protein